MVSYSIRLSAHARLSMANIIKILMKTHEKRGLLSHQRIHCYLICHRNWSPCFTSLFFQPGHFSCCHSLSQNYFENLLIWRCVDDLVESTIYRFHLRYMHSSFYLIRSIVNVFLPQDKSKTLKQRLYLTRWPKRLFGFISVSS